MKKTRAIPILSAVLAAILMLGPSTAAQSLKSARAEAAEEKALQSEASFTGRICGRSIDVEIDWDSARDWPSAFSLADACGGALSALEAACRAGGAPAVESFVCTGDGAGPSYRRGELSYGATPGGNGYDETSKLLEDLR
jgi:hypothetical protein